MYTFKGYMMNISLTCMYKESLQTAEYICKTDKAIHSNFQQQKMVNHI